MNGTTITAASDATLSGQTFNATSNWTLLVLGTGLAADIEVEYGQTSFGNDITCTRSIDGGNVSGGGDSGAAGRMGSALARLSMSGGWMSFRRPSRP